MALLAKPGHYKFMVGTEPGKNYPTPLGVVWGPSPH
jgi:hypothetical protein